jgi:hypothetical protein
MPEAGAKPMTLSYGIGINQSSAVKTKEIK